MGAIFKANGNRKIIDFPLALVSLEWRVEKEIMIDLLHFDIVVILVPNK